MAAKIKAGSVRTKDVAFFSGPGLRIAGRFYLPARGRDRRAGIVFCHGFGGTKEGTPPGLSRLLAQHGYTVLTFDYRGFGESDGPRGRLVQTEQIEDTVHAIEYLAQQATIDPGKIGIYGTSFGGGIALLAAKRSERPRAAFITVPVTSGSHWLKSMNRWYEYRELKARAMQAIAKKAVSGEMEMVDRFDIMVPDPLTRARYPDRVPFALETFYHVAHYEPLAEAQDIHFPVGIIAIRDDQLVPVEQATMLYDRLRGPKLLRLLAEGSHFSVYDELLPTVAKEAIEWFDKHLEGTHAYT
ncbi:MAG: alpha/beta hydrolase [Alphaproteobacteria bacterium]